MVLFQLLIAQHRRGIELACHLGVRVLAGTIMQPKVHRVVGAHSQEVVQAVAFPEKDAFLELFGRASCVPPSFNTESASRRAEPFSRPPGMVNRFLSTEANR